MSTLDGPLQSRSPPADDGESPADDRPSTGAALPISRPPAVVRTVAFWFAVALPALYVPLVLAGVSTPGERTALAAMLAANVVALYVGHGHRPDG